MSQKLFNSSLLCPLCNKHTHIITDQESGELICVNCGGVLSDKVQDTRAEWNAYDPADKNLKSRTGSPTSLAKFDRGLSTVIGKVNRDASGQQIDATMRNKVDRWRTWDIRSQTRDSTKRNLQSAFMQLYMIKGALGLPESVVEKIAYLYRKIQDKGLVKGRTIKGAVAVACYIACREMGIPRTLKEIASISNLKEREIARVYRKVMFDLDLKIPQDDPMKKLVKIANKCKITEKAKRYAIKIMAEIIRKGMSAGKNPMGLAGAALYVSCKNYDEDVTQREIAEAAGVTEVTIRHDLDRIEKMIEIE
ncbi:MAG: transcription initiation factor IIB [Nitrosopumilus sp.]|nr:transcription initiation factor IIB [Nitrosopumilus sp.]